MRIPFTAGAGVMAALRRVGRTEDVQWSPSGGRIALAGYTTDRVLVFDVQVELCGERVRVEVSGGLEAGSASFDHPHGLAWIDERTLVVANRYGRISIVELPAGPAPAGPVTLEPVAVVGADTRDLVKYPGSVSAFPIGMGLVELLVCNNHVHQVSRHLVDRRCSYAVRASESLVSAGLQLPDGVAHSRSGRWIAVSNHDRYCTFVYRYDERLHAGSDPDGVLRGTRFPHGVVFTPDERWILAADAGAPVVRAYYSADGNWDGEHEPVSAVQIVSDADYERGRFMPGEGGPKGIDLTPDGTLLVATCDEDRLAFFDMRPVIGTVSAPADPACDAAEAERARLFLVRYLGAARTRVDEATAAIREAGERELSLLLNSRWWRLTSPLRELSTSLRYNAIRARHRAASLIRRA